MGKRLETLSQKKIFSSLALQRNMCFGSKTHVFLHLGTLQAEPLSRRIERGSACRVASWKQEKIFKQLKNIIASLMQVRIENISFCWTV